MRVIKQEVLTHPNHNIFGLKFTWDYASSAIFYKFHSDFIYHTLKEFATCFNKNCSLILRSILVDSWSFERNKIIPVKSDETVIL